MINRAAAVALASDSDPAKLVTLNDSPCAQIHLQERRQPGDLGLLVNTEGGESVTDEIL